jgi:C-terminal processing protease CtpA/Prc
VDNAANTYANAGVNAIQANVTGASCGWVVDLRDNAGGNAFAMLAAVAPLLGDASVVGFAYPRGGTEWITVSAGRLTGFDTPPVEVKSAVDVLTNQRTASAAELVAVGFNGQANALRVGEATAGLTSSNVSHKLSDGASLLISVAWYVDRSQNEFTGPLQPDVEISLSPKAQLEKAVEDVRSRC